MKKIISMDTAIEDALSYCLSLLFDETEESVLRSFLSAFYPDALSDDLFEGSSDRAWAREQALGEICGHDDESPSVFCERLDILKECLRACGLQYQSESIEDLLDTSPLQYVPAVTEIEFENPLDDGVREIQANYIDDLKRQLRERGICSYPADDYPISESKSRLDNLEILNRLIHFYDSTLNPRDAEIIRTSPYYQHLATIDSDSNFWLLLPLYSTLIQRTKTEVEQFRTVVDGLTFDPVTTQKLGFTEPTGPTNTDLGRRIIDRLKMEEWTSILTLAQSVQDVAKTLFDSPSVYRWFIDQYLLCMWIEQSDPRPGSGATNQSAADSADILARIFQSKMRTSRHRRTGEHPLRRLERAVMGNDTPSAKPQRRRRLPHLTPRIPRKTASDG